MLEPTESSSYQYHAYLLRLWREAGQGRWQFSLQTAVSHQTRYFATLEEMTLFLAQLVELDNNHEGEA